MKNIKHPEPDPNCPHLTATATATATATMISATKNEITPLVVGNNTNTKEVVYIDSYNNDAYKKKSHQHQNQQDLCSRNYWKALVGLASIALLVVGIFNGTTTVQERKAALTPACRFCDDQSPPYLHHDKSYTIGIPDDSNVAVVTVTPMTISFEYELYDGENLFTRSGYEFIPNLDFDYAILGVSSVRNIDRATGKPVSLDEVYVHHFSVLPINMLGAEVLTRSDGNGNGNDNDNDNDDPYMRFPNGYALHVLADEFPFLRMNAHLLSNKNLAPIGGSMERAHRECNECYYAPGKGSDCTPEFSGTLSCCGDSRACTTGGENCACAVTTSIETEEEHRATTKYRIELDLLISRDVRKFQRVDQWNLSAPSCSINLNGDAVLEIYPPDSACYSRHTNLNQKWGRSDSAMLPTLYYGGGAIFHQIPPQQPNEDPFVRTATSVLAPTGGKIVWLQSHLHTGGVNATLYKNGKIVCATDAVYGTNPDASANARNEKGHLIRIASCYDQLSDGGIRFESGDVFTTESFYYRGIDNDPLPQQQIPGVVGGEHKNVMSMFFMGVVLDGEAAFLTTERTSFNLWNNFVPVAGVELYQSNDGKSKQTGKHLR